MSGEYAMSTPSQKPANFDFDFAPAVRLFVDNMEVWKQNYEQFLKTSGAAPVSGPELLTKPAEQALGNWKAAGEALFTSFIEQQVEVCRFFGRRWETYLDYPRRLAACKTPADIGEVEMEFLKRMAEDYTQESAKLAKPVNDLMSAWASGRFAR
jgi:hypothetical protein